MERPKIKIETDSIDRIVFFIGLIGVFALLALPLYYFAQLPDTIATHFDVKGNPNGYGAKWEVWLLPAIGVIMFIGLHILIRYPHSYNYLSPITPENARQKYTFATKTIRYLNSLISVFFAYLTYATINTALGIQNGVSPLSTGFFMIAVFSITGYFLYKSNEPVKQQ